MRVCTSEACLLGRALLAVLTLSVGLCGHRVWIIIRASFTCSLGVTAEQLAKTLTFEISHEREMVRFGFL